MSNDSKVKKAALRFVPNAEWQRGFKKWRAPAADGADYIIAEGQRLGTGLRRRQVFAIYTVHQGDRLLGDAPTIKAAKALAQAQATAQRATDAMTDAIVLDVVRNAWPYLSDALWFATKKNKDRR